jgi:SAM-dependent methyltransferase
MRLSLRGDTVLERLALRFGLVPRPAAEAWAGMGLSGSLVTATRLGLTARLAAGPATALELAEQLDLDPVPTELLLSFLATSGHLAYRDGRYRLRSHRWLDPASRLSVASFVAATGDYWQWWANLPEVVRTGRPVKPHDAAPDDPYWRRYIMGQYDLARLSAGEVARKLVVPSGATSILDIGGGHGWYSAELCRRHPGLSATVLDLPGSSAVGRSIIAAAGLADRVSHRDGDALTAELGGPYDVVLCFNLIHHLGPDDVTGLFRRIRSALAPGGTLAVMDAFAGARRRNPAAEFLGLFMYLSSGAQVYSYQQLVDWLAAAEFARPRKIAMRRIPGLALYQVGVG